jgi:hypothetical protein
MFKKRLAILGAVLLVVFTSQLLWGGGENGSGEEHPWGQNTGGTGNTGNVGNSTSSSSTVSSFTQIFIVRPAPMGGFYILRVSLPSGASAKMDAGGKKVEN